VNLGNEVIARYIEGDIFNKTLRARTSHNAEMGLARGGGHKHVQLRKMPALPLR
tara:strand:+ start:449 stop:610 length:162 start_codon:yes stop_codon:yes gene_type:complete